MNILVLLTNNVLIEYLNQYHMLLFDFSGIIITLIGSLTLK
jgi:hypothetical protein